MSQKKATKLLMAADRPNANKPKSWRRCWHDGRRGTQSRSWARPEARMIAVNFARLPEQYSPHVDSALASLRTAPGEKLAYVSYEEELAKLLSLLGHLWNSKLFEHVRQLARVRLGSKLGVMT